MGDVDLRRLEREMAAGVDPVGAASLLVALRARLQRFPSYLEVAPRKMPTDKQQIPWLAHGVARDRRGALRTFCGKSMRMLADYVVFEEVNTEPVCLSCLRSRSWQYLCGKPFRLGELRRKVPLWLRKRYGRARVADTLFWVRVQDLPRIPAEADQLTTGLFEG